MFKIFTTIIALAVLSGCGVMKPMPIADVDLSELKGKSLLKTKTEMPDMMELTVGRGFFGAFGMLAGISAGNELVKNNNIQDPAQMISLKLAKEFAKKNKLKLNVKSTLVETNDVKKISDQNSKVDYILDIRTQNWNLAYFPFDMSAFRVNYLAHLRLIDTKTKMVIAESQCHRVVEESEGAPTHDQMDANNMKLFKSETQKAINYCVKEFKKTTLRI